MMRHLVRAPRAPFLAGLLLVAGAAVAGADERPWIEVRSPRFTIVSEAGEKSAREMAWQFEQVHAVFTQAYPWGRMESGRPFIVLVARNEASLRALSPRFHDRWRARPTAAFVSGPGRDFVAIRSDLDGSLDPGENPYFTAYSGYVSIVLDASFPGQLPFWFQRGMQSFLGNTLVREKDVHIGRLLKGYLRLLHQGSRYSLPELMAIERGSRSFLNEADRQVFDAQSWLLVHYLFFGEAGALRPKLNRYADLLRNGRPGPEAFRDAFGDPEPLQKGLSFYLSRQLYGFTRLDLDVSVDRASFRARPVAAPEAAALRAAFLQAMQEPAAEAQALAESALRADPAQPVAHEVLGLIADAANRTDDARASLARAVDNGSRSYFAHYRLAQLLWAPDNDRATLARTASVLEQAVQLNPDHHWSLRYLADTRVSLGEAQAALDPARKAVRMAPGEADHRRTLARVLGNLGELDAAQQEAGRALALATTDEDKRYARETLGWLSEIIRAAKTSPGAPAAAAAGPAPATEGVGRVEENARGEGGRTITLDKHPCERNDPGLCRHWLAAAETACQEGSLEACSSAGWAYTGAPGVDRDPAKAVRMLEKACAGGHQLGCVNLAVNLAARRTPEDRKRALDLLSRACATGGAEACRLKASLEATRR